MKLQLTGLQLAGVLSAAIASGLYDPTKGIGLGGSGSSKPCMCWAIEELPLPYPTIKEVKDVIEMAMVSFDVIFLINALRRHMGHAGEIYDEERIRFATGLVRWYSTLVLWGIQYGDEHIDLNDVPVLTFNTKGKTVIND